MMIEKLDPASHHTIVKQFEMQVEQRSDAIACIDRTKQFTYSELNARANQIAHWLIAHGAGADLPVALYLDRSVDFLAALLGIFKAGAVYAPVDPAYPAAYRQQILETAQARFIISRQAVCADHPVSSDVALLLLDDDMLANQPSHNPHVVSLPEQLACLYFTSGSTGKPKGIAMLHQQLRNVLDNFYHYFPFTEGEMVAQRTASIFSVSLKELLTGLLAGVTQLIIAGDEVTDSRQFLSLLAKYRVTRLNITPSHLESLLDGVPEAASEMASLRYCIISGEPLTSALRDKMKALLPALQIWNVYGCTELNDTLYYPPKGQDSPAALVPVGRPIKGIRPYVLGKGMRRLPPGETGTLFIGGQYLPRGYWQQPGLTAEKLVPNPFSDVPGSRLFDTGDTVRYLPDGQLEYCGRNDFQFKVRGQRVDVYQVEHVLKNYDGIAACAVAGHTDAAGVAYIVAYYVLAPAAETFPDMNDLHAYLSGQLPSYMVPSAWVQLEEMPLLPNGKLNRLALPVPGSVRNEVGYVAPRTPTEEVLERIWADVLGQDKVSIHDNFFALGGHSLLATKLVARIRHEMQQDLPLRQFFECNTIEKQAALLAEGSHNIATTSSIPRAVQEREQSLIPLSPLQERLWLVSQLPDQITSYNTPVAWRLRGGLNVPALCKAFDALVARHETLRTTIDVANGVPLQKIHAPEHLAIHTGDSSESELIQWVRTASAHAFDLSRGPLINVALWRLAENDHVLFMNLHHIITDGWSMNVMVNDLQRLYLAETTGQPARLPELAIQYADYAVWRRQHDLSASLDYWRATLSDYRTNLAVRADYPGAIGRRGLAKTVRQHFAAAFSKQLSDFSRAEGLTLFMTLSAGMAILLQRYSQFDDICLGTTSGGRERLELEPLIGFFINVLALRIKVDERMSGREFLQQVKEVLLQAYEHQAIPFEQIQAVFSEEGKTLPRNMLPVTIRHQNFPPAESLEWQNDLIVEGLNPEGNTAKCDFDWQFYGEGEDITLLIEYDSALFKEETVKRMTGHFQNILQSLMDMPQRNLDKVNMLGQGEQALLTAWRASERPLPDINVSVVEQFESQVNRQPDGIACIDHAGQLTYGELNTKANQIAHWLIAHGAGPDVPVALYLDRSTDFLAALMGIFKAGAVYAPVDPAYPAAYRQQILESAQAKIVVSRYALCSDHSISDEAALLLVDGDMLATQPVHNPRIVSLPEQLACLYFTSGSTGKPKGVAMPHRQLRNVLGNFYRNFPFTEGDMVAQRTSSIFLVSLKELLTGLLAGVPQLIIAADDVKDSKLFLNLLARYRVTRLNITPSHLESLLDDIPEAASQMATLRYCITAGEPLTQVLRAKVAQMLPAVRLWNNYGCTELNDTLYSAPDAQDSSGALVPMGHPIAGIQIYVLDQKMQQVPPGEPGTLFVSGQGVPRGYWRQADLSAEKLVPNPFSDVPGSRLFNTGDTVRFLPDGRLEYFGRNDFQFKVRGQRVDVYQVENILKNHDGIVACAVTGHTHVSGTSYLVAYFVAAPESGAHVETEALRSYLASQLPSYMVPSAWVRLDALPLLPNGKLDRLSLPVPDMLNRSSYIAPSTPQQEQLAAIWTEVLGIEKIGIHDNFFNLGGHSLTLTKLISRIRHVFEVDLPIQAIFENPTLIQQIAYINKTQTGLPDIVLPPIERKDRDNQTLAIGPYMERFWFIDQLQPGNMRYTRLVHYPVMQPFEPKVFVAAVNEVIRRHAILRTTFPSINGEPVQIIMPSLTLDVPLIDLLIYPEQEREAYLGKFFHSATHKPFDLANESAIRAAIVRVSEEKYVLSVMLHHIVYDYWSMGILIHEIQTLCSAYAAGKSSPLPELPMQYADFTEWQNHALQGEPLEKLVAYAASQLQDAPPVFEWAITNPRPDKQTYHGATRYISLPAPLTQALYGLSKENHCTLFITLFAGFNALLSRYSGQHDFCVGTLSANRNRIEIEPLIGNFVNLLALRFKCQETDSYRTLLEHTRKQIFAAQAHQDLPFERLIEQPFVHRNPSYSPIFQVMFTMENENIGNQGNNAELQDISDKQDSQQLDEMYATYARFDLTVTAKEQNHQIDLMFEYNTDLFERDTMSRLMEGYLALLTDVVTNPDAPIADLAIMPSADYQRIVVDWNNTGNRTVEPFTLHQMFEQQAATRPDQLALQYGQETLSYAELNARANQLARHLRARGVRTDDLVALYLEPSFQLVIGILGILKAGAGYVPLDPAYPAERLAWMIEDAHPVIMLTQQALTGGLPASSLPVICLDSGWNEIAHHLDLNLENVAHPESAAYVIYTSGSTGRPKGTVVSHAASTNFIKGLVGRLYPAIPEQEVLRVGLNASYAFDGSLKQLLLILYGCPIILIPSAVRYDSEILRAFIVDNKLDVFNCTPSQLRTLLTDGKGLSCRYVLVGGEAIDQELWKRMMLFPEQCFYNVYGPTECAAVTTACRIGEHASPVIGKPLNNVRVYILDRQLQPVPAGIPGEVYIAGEGLARGYLGRPDLTAERFVPDSFSTTGERLYRTGDQARFLSDGSIDYIGRLDRQIKIRGYRIEIGEIEASLARHPQVGESIVVVRGEQPDDLYLVAYVTAAANVENSLLNVDDLRISLQQFLPAYMIPSRIIVLDHVPLTVNGKIDYAALPSADNANEEEKEIVALTPTEETLSRLWEKVLKIDKIGIHENFLDVGGHSLRALVLLAAIKRTFGLTLTIATIFSYPSIAAQAQFIDSKKETPLSLVVPLSPRPGAPSLFCIHTVGGQVTYYRDLAKHLGERFSVFGIQSPEAAGLPNESLSLDDLATNYAAVIKAAQPQGPYQLLGWSAGALIALTVASKLEKQGETVRYIGLVDVNLAERTEENLERKIILSAFHAFSGGRMRDGDMKVLADLLHEQGINDLADDKVWKDNAGLLLEHVQQWTNLPPTTETLSLIRKQVVLIHSHFKNLIPKFVFPQLAVAPHLCWAEQSSNRLVADSFDFSKLSKNPDGIVANVIHANHFDMLQPPQVVSLAEAILSQTIF